MTPDFLDISDLVRRLELKTRRIVNSTFTGAYQSAFKGQGLSFSEVRAYQPGDDVRFIDWNVTARTGKPHLKVFEEERELTVLLAVDVSASGRFGSGNKRKMDLATELASVLGFSAMNNQDRVGLLLFSDEVEHYLPPKKGRRHMFRILRDIMQCSPKSQGTSLATAMAFLSKVLTKSALVIVVSDFLDCGYEVAFSHVARRHDVMPIVIEDAREISWPSAGTLFLEDAESGETVLVDTGNETCRKKFEQIMLSTRLDRDRFFRSCGVLPLGLQVAQDYIGPLSRYFQRRVLMR